MINDNQNRILIGNEYYKIIDTNEINETDDKIYLQAISIPAIYLIEFLETYNNLDIAIQYPVPYHIGDEWIAWGIGKFFNWFSSPMLNAWGVCLEQCTDKLVPLSIFQDITPLLNFINHNKDNFYYRRIQKKLGNYYFSQPNYKNILSKTNEINTPVLISIVHFLKTGVRDEITTNSL